MRLAKRSRSRRDNAARVGLGKHLSGSRWLIGLLALAGLSLQVNLWFADDVFTVNKRWLQKFHALMREADPQRFPDLQG